MKHGSLFSGIGGFDLAAEWMGWENVFHCEWNPFGQKVLHHYWPKAEQFTDISKTDFTKYANKIDILTGGFPCQPYSQAGKRKGKEDERHLWPHMLRAIKEIQPRWVVGENVFGIVNWSGGLVFHEVQTDLEAAGYEVFPYVLPAAAVNAPHRRDRIWFVAYSKSARTRNDIGGLRSVSKRCDSWKKIATFNTNTDSNGLNQCNSDNEVNASEGRINALGSTNKSNGDGDVADTNNTRFQTFNNKKPELGKKNRTKTFSGNNIESIYSRTGWENFPTQSPICSGNDGISDRLDSITFPKWRNESIKAGGNAIVPQVVYQIFKAIEQYELLTAPATDTRQ